MLQNIKNLFQKMKILEKYASYGHFILNFTFGDKNYHINVQCALL